MVVPPAGPLALAAPAGPLALVILAIAIAAAAVLQALCLSSPRASSLMGSVALPWRWQFASLYGQRYGRATARDPMAALCTGVIPLAVTFVGLYPLAFRLAPATAFDPWVLLDFDSPVGHRARHTFAAFGAPQDELRVLMAACDGRASILNGSLLAPLVRAHDALVDSSGEMSSDGGRTYSQACARDAASGRCAVSSFLTLSNPDAVDTSGHLDGSIDQWVPALATKAATSYAHASMPYEERMRSLLEPALRSRLGSLRLGLPAAGAAAVSVSTTAAAAAAAAAATPLLTDASLTSTIEDRSARHAPTPLSPSPISGGAAGGAFVSFAIVRLLHHAGNVFAEGIRLLMRAPSLAPPDGSSDDALAKASQEARSGVPNGLQRMPPIGPPRAVATALSLVGLQPPPITSLHDAPTALGAIARFPTRRHADGIAGGGAGSRGGDGGSRGAWVSSGGQMMPPTQTTEDRAAATSAGRWERAARATLARLNQCCATPSVEAAAPTDGARVRTATRAASAGTVGASCVRVAWDSAGTRDADVRSMMAQLLVGGLLWAVVVIVFAAHHLSCLAPVLRRPLAHATCAVGCGVLASLGALGSIGWLHTVGWPRSPQLGSGCGADHTLGCLHSYALLVPFAVLPLTLDAAFVVAHVMHEAWRTHASDVAEERFARAISIVAPRLLAAATAAAAAPVSGAVLSSRVGAHAVAPPLMELAIGLSLGVLYAHCLVLSLFWGGLLLELRGAVRVLLRAASNAPDVAHAKSIYASFRRDSGTQIGCALVLGATLALAAVGSAHLPTSTAVVGELPAWGAAARYHAELLRMDGGRPRPLTVELTAAQLAPMPAGGGPPPLAVTAAARPMDLGDVRQCRVLIASTAVLRRSPLVLSIDSWFDRFRAQEGSEDCTHLSERARAGGLQRLMVREPGLVDGLLLEAQAGDAADAAAVVLATRWRVELQLPAATPLAIAAAQQLQAELRAVADAADADADAPDAHNADDTAMGGGDAMGAARSSRRGPHEMVTLALGGAGIATLELARRAPSATRGWSFGAAIGAAAATIGVIAPLGGLALLVVNGVTAQLLLGALALLPPPQGAGQLAWVVLATCVCTHAPALALQTLRTAQTRAMGGPADELSAFGALTPPLWRAAATSLVALAPLPTLAPLVYLRSLGALLLAAVALGGLAALVMVPLLHAALRRPQAPMPPPSVSQRRPHARRSAEPSVWARIRASGERLLPGGGAAPPPSYGSAQQAGPPMATPYYAQGAAGSTAHGCAMSGLMESWQDQGTLPVGATVSGLAKV